MLVVTLKCLDEKIGAVLSRCRQPNGERERDANKWFIALCWSLAYRNKEEDYMDKPEGRKIFIFRFVCDLKLEMDNFLLPSNLE